MDYFLAIRLNRPDDVVEIIKNEPCKLLAVSKDGFSGLQLACKYGFTEIVTILLEYGADVEAVDIKYGRTCLHWASICGYNNIILMLYRDASNVFSDILNKVDKTEHTSLMLACKGGRLETVKLLLAAGADITINLSKTNGVPLTVLDMCNGSNEIKSALLSYSQTTDHNTTSSAHKTIDDHEIVWGLADSLGLNIDKLSGGRSKLIAKGWLQRCSSTISSSSSSSSGSSNSCGTDSSGSSRCKNISNDTESIKPPTLTTTDHSPLLTTTTTNNSNNNKKQLVEVIVKLNHNKLELQQEIDNRILIQSMGCITEIVAIQYNSVLTLRQTTGTSSLWYAILLEKGIIDMHHLYDAMAQGATVSKLHDVTWKLNVIKTLCNITKEFSRKGLVWCDLKPSNFIVCLKKHSSSGSGSDNNNNDNDNSSSDSMSGGVGSNNIVSSSDNSSSAVAATTSSNTTSTDNNTDEITTTDTSTTTTSITPSEHLPQHQTTDTVSNKYTPYSYINTTKTHKWLQQSNWDLDYFTLKATDLSAIYPNNTMVLKENLSCTARFLCPSIAKIMRNKEKTYVTVSDAHMQWSLGMTVLQLLHTENKNFWSSFNISIHSNDIYNYLCEDVRLQSLLYEYIDIVIKPLLQDNKHCESIIQSLKATLCVQDTERVPLCCDTWFDS